MRGKITPISVIAALAIVIGICAGPASATSWCETEAKASECAMFHGKSTVLKASAPSAAFEAGGFTSITCTSSETRVETTQGPTAAGVTLSGIMTALTFGGCKTSGGTSCTITSANKPFAAETAWTAGNDGTLTLAGTPGITIKCGILVNCAYAAEPKFEEPKLTFLGGVAAKLEMASSAFFGKEEEGAECGAMVWKETNYTVSAPQPLYIAQS